MTHGKRTCKILKEIRQQIADKNDIEYVTSECTFQGECEGTCPKCEAELRYLENELNKRRQLGKVVAVAGISLGLASTFSACNTPQQQPNTPISEQKIAADTVNMDTIPAIESILIPIELSKLEGDAVQLEDFEIDGAVSTVDIKQPEEDFFTEGLIIVPNDDNISDEDPPFIIVEVMPEYPGGDEARMKFLADNLQYPKTTRHLPSGKVVIGFVVEKDGSLTNFSIIRSVDRLLDEEVIRVIKLMPKWKAGEQRGKPVRVQMQIPITFTLD